MNTTTRYGLKAADRLKSRKRIERLFREGKAFSHFPFRVIYILEPGDTQLQAGFTVSTRYFKRATDRNRIKRQMREAYRLQRQPLEEALKAYGHQLDLFFVYTGNDLPEYQLVSDKTAAALKRLQKIVHETDETGTPT